MNEMTCKPLYICGPEDPLFIEKGLYSGLKERDGLPCALPICLSSNQEYTSTGLLDALPHEILRKNLLNKISLRIRIKGTATISFYILLESERVYHSNDISLKDGDNQIRLPKRLIDDPNGRLIFFKVKALKNETIVEDWAYISDAIPQHLANSPILHYISRTLGDSKAIINQFIELKEKHAKLEKAYSDCFLMPFPSITIYESDQTSYAEASKKVKGHGLDFIKVKYNQHNLGGGGNMCLAVNNEFVKAANSSQFAMMDSDTFVPFRTLYFSVISSAFQSTQKKSSAVVPTVLYSKTPNLILESGALFGRGNWGVATPHISQPCIAPQFHNESITSKKIKSALSSEDVTDYPPFIYSIFCSNRKEDKLHFLPTPFFLRGDDIEMGLHLEKSDIPCNLNSWLVVFQQPKHSLWHEFMAILHGTCLIFAYDNRKHGEYSGEKYSGLRDYFTSRINCHSRARDIDGLTVYNEVLKRLISILEWKHEELVSRFHDPDFYLQKRNLNSAFTASNFKLIKAMKRNSGDDISNIASLSFLYYEQTFNELKDKASGNLKHLAFINNSNRTANIINFREVDSHEMQSMRIKMLNQLETILANSDLMSKKCQRLCSRQSILNDYLPKYSRNAQRGKKRYQKSED